MGSNIGNNSGLEKDYGPTSILSRTGSEGEITGIRGRVQARRREGGVKVIIQKISLFIER